MSANRDRARALLANATPGPWNCQPHEPMRSDVYAVGCPDSTMIARVSRTPVNVMTSARRARPEYDAALIAAAPGLLAALCDENDALRAELAQEAPPGALCVCVGATHSFDPGRNVIRQRAGYSITAGVGCPACRGTGIATAEGGE